PLPGARQRLEPPDQVGRPLPLLRVVRTTRRPRPHRPGGPHVPDRWLAALAEADRGPLGVVGPGGNPRHVRQRRHPTGVGLGRPSPRLLAPRLGRVLLSVRQAGAGSLASTTATATSRSASRFLAQRA